MDAPVSQGGPTRRTRRRRVAAVVKCSLTTERSNKAGPPGRATSGETEASCSESRYDGCPVWKRKDRHRWAHEDD